MKLIFESWSRGLAVAPIPGLRDGNPQVFGDSHHPSPWPSIAPPPRQGTCSLGAIALIIACTIVTSNPVMAQRNKEPIQSEAMSPEDNLADANYVGTTVPLFNRLHAWNIQPLDKTRHLGSQSHVIQGIVRDAKGPVAGAVVVARAITRRSSEPGDFIARTNSNARGEYALQVQTATDSKNPNLGYEVLATDRSNRFSFGVAKPKLRFRGIRSPVDKENADQLRTDVILPTTAPVTGRVVSSTGKPLANVAVYLRSIVSSGVGSGADPFRAPQGRVTHAGAAAFAPNHEFRFAKAFGPIAKTDANGKFAIRPPADGLLDLGFAGEAFYPNSLRVSATAKWGRFGEGMFYQHDRPIHVAPAEVELRKSISVSIRLVDSENQPVKTNFEFKFIHGKRLISWRIRKGSELKTTAELLQNAADVNGLLKARLVFPSESELLDQDLTLSVNDLIRSRMAEVQTNQGNRISGRVVTWANQKGIPNVVVHWHSQHDYIPDIYMGVTNQKGRWEFVAPKHPGFLTVTSRLAPEDNAMGYDLVTRDDFNRDSTLHRYTQPYKPNAASSAEDEAYDFEVRKTQRPTIKVVSTKGDPIAGARVTVSYSAVVSQDGRDYLLRQELAEPKTTNEQGECKITLNQANWKDGVVEAQLLELDDIGNLLNTKNGRSSITPKTKSPIKITLK